MKLSTKDIFKISNRDLVIAQSLTTQQSLELAKTTTDPKILANLRQNNDTDVKIAVSQNPNCDDATKLSLLAAATKELIISAIQHIDWIKLFKGDFNKISLFISGQSKYGSEFYINNMITPELLEGLAKTGNRTFNIMIANNPKINIETINYLYNLQDYDINYNLDKNKAVQIVKQFKGKKLNELTDATRDILISFENDPVKLVEIMKAGITEAGYVRLSSKNLDPKILNFIFKKYPNNVEIESNLVQNKNTNTKLLKEIVSKTKNILIQYEALNHPNCDLEIIEQLSKSKNQDIAEKLSSISKTPTNLLEQVLKNFPENIKIQRYVSRRENLTPDTINILSLSNDKDVLVNLSSLPNLPENVIENLYLSNNSSIMSRIVNKGNNAIINKINSKLQILKTTDDQNLLKEAWEKNKPMYNEVLLSNDNISNDILIDLISKIPYSFDTISRSKRVYDVKNAIGFLNLSNSSIQAKFFQLYKGLLDGGKLTADFVQTILEGSFDFKKWLFGSWEHKKTPMDQLSIMNFGPESSKIKQVIMKQYLELNNKQLYNTEKDTHITIPTHIFQKNQNNRNRDDYTRSGEELYQALLKRQELQYKYDKLNEYYKNREVPPDSKFPVIQFNLSEINHTIIKFLYYIIWEWRRRRLNDRARRIKEMLQNEDILSKMKQAIGSKNIELQRKAIEMGLNTIHSSGSMIEHMGLDKIRLDYLSNMDTSKWERQLEHMSSSKKDIKISVRESL